MDVTKEPSATVSIDYTNWRGERSIRVIVPQSIRFGVSGWHAEPQWLLQAIDVAKGEGREFAMCDIHRWINDADGVQI